MAAEPTRIADRLTAADPLQAALDRYEGQVRLFESVVSTTPDFVYVFDRDGHFLYANPRLLEVWGMTLPEIVGRTPRELGYEQWHHDMHMREIAEVIETRRPIKGEVPFRAPLTGIFGVYEYIFTPVIGADGTVERIAGTTRDVTERKNIERERDAMLEQERRAREAAEAFLAVMSHELKTPVTSIYGTATLLARDPSREDLPELLADMQDETERLRRIIDDLLVLSGVERGLLRLSPEPILVQHALGEVISDVARRHPEVTIVRDAPSWLPPVTADTTGLRQVLYNLVSNAAKYAGADGPITVKAEQVRGGVEISVEDEGPGLGADPGAVFGLFYRAPHTARLSAGTGIGLYVARELVRAMGAGIEGTNRREGGARFRFTLPLAVETGALED